VSAPAPRRADLHAHTRASDGVYTAEELVDRAVAAGLWALAVSDHDTLGALGAAGTAGSARGLVVFPGVEFSCLAHGPDGRRLDIHLLGLFLNGLNAQDQARIEVHLEERRRTRLMRGRQMVANLAAAGVGIAWPEVEAEAAGGAVGRPHVARVLVRHGLAADIDDAFHRYLSPGRPGHVEQHPLRIEEAVGWIREAAGAVVWAHPGLTPMPAEAAPWRDQLDGLEADHPKHDAAQRETLRALAGAWGIVATGGSDAHGTPGRDAVGDCWTPEPAVEALAARGQARKA